MDAGETRANVEIDVRKKAVLRIGGAEAAPAWRTAGIVMAIQQKVNPSEACRNVFRGEAVAADGSEGNNGRRDWILMDTKAMNGPGETPAAAALRDLPARLRPTGLIELIGRTSP
jgi:hypothetical protein